ncbi:glycoside hydrolase family 5 protein [Dysgonomonas sp. 521]|uniref:glycoside hydrolase family 5 protein n=1 Tax=Dysgonomonas sp. 521 TaxID=2302932 RepID=UPI0013D86E35|nr:glycoside hydrolase family 5 protein [Dysgonomonas sp. 521]NDV94817.1 glycoside hydrolase family 5 protein [Dysgonomonas sp. 521]
MLKYLYKVCILAFSLFLINCSGEKKDSGSVAAQTFVGQHGQLSVKGTSLIDAKGDTIVLKGTSFGWHNWWPRFYDKSTVAWLQSDWNCNVVRAAIGVEPDGAYLQNQELAIKCLDEVVDAAIANGIYVIIDWHSHGIKTEEAKAFFTRAANKYKDCPNIIYEIFNEPVEDSWETVKAYSEEVIKTIRAIDKNNIILVGTPHWDQDIHLAADNPITGYNNIMYTLHFYAATHKQYLRDRGDYALSKGLPLFVSECAGMEASGDGSINKEEWQSWVNWMASHHISWVAWSVSDKDETCSMIKDNTSPATEWKDTDLKEWGIIVKNTLNNKF